jgi:hypothetical protein
MSRALRMIRSPRPSRHRQPDRPDPDALMRSAAVGITFSDGQLVDFWTPHLLEDLFTSADDDAAETQAALVATTTTLTQLFVRRLERLHQLLKGQPLTEKENDA